MTPDSKVRTPFSSSTGNSSPPQPAALRGLAGIFGLDARAAALVIAVDMLVFGMDTVSAELLLPLGVAIAAALGLIVYRMQRHWYGDDDESAVIKGMVVGLLTAIPIPIAPLFSVPAGLLGLVRALRRDEA